MKKALIFLVLLIAVFLGEVLIYDKNSHPEEVKPFIAVTSFPLYEICTHLLEDKIEVKKLIPFGVETHAYTPSVKTMTQVNNAELFVYNGLGMETWITQTYDNALDMSQFVKLNAVEQDAHCNHEKDEHEHSHGESDPHYWLDTENMIRMTLVLAQKLEKRFPELKETIEKNEVVYIDTLKTLNTQYEQRLKTCKFREIVVNHNAFGYLAHKYDFHTHFLTGLSPDEQVSAKKMTELASFVKEESIKTIFFESFVSPKMAETLSKETGAKVESLQPLANVTQEESKKGYVFIMQENLEKISNAMECE